MEEMNTAMVNNWNSVVTDDDVVIHAGDVMFGDKKKCGPFINQLKGQKILISGNHDPKEVVLNECWMNSAQQLDFEYDGYIFHIKHWPFKEKIEPKENVIFCHGHTHNNIPQLTNNQISLCVEHWNFAPVSIETIIETWKNYYEKL